MRAAPPTSRAVSVETRGATPAPAPAATAADDASTAGASPDTADDTTTLQSCRASKLKGRKIGRSPSSGFTLRRVLSRLANLAENRLDEHFEFKPIFAHFTKIRAEIGSLWHLGEIILMLAGTQLFIEKTIGRFSTITFQGGKTAGNRCCRVAITIRPGGRVTNAVGTIFRKIFVGTRARPI